MGNVRATRMYGQLNRCENFFEPLCEAKMRGMCGIIASPDLKDFGHQSSL